MSDFKNIFASNTLISFITAGDPCIEKTKDYIISMAKAGSDIIEIGLPFSDPVAEGPIIEKAHIRALAAGTTTQKIFDMLSSLRNEINIPLIFTSYINTVFMYGVEHFFRKCNECNVSGIIIPDLPYEEKKEVIDTANKYGVCVITVIAPASPDRIRSIARNARGFIYLTAPMDRSVIDPVMKEIRSVSDLPVVLSYDPGTPEQAKSCLQFMDGVIMGDEIAKAVDIYQDHADSHIHTFIREMKHKIK